MAGVWKSHRFGLLHVQHFNNVDNATEWALAMMAGVSAIYTQELNGLFLLQATFVHLWQTPDPMSACQQDAGAMLDNFRIHLADQQRLELRPT